VQWWWYTLKKAKRPRPVIHTLGLAMGGRVPSLQEIAYLFCRGRKIYERRWTRDGIRRRLLPRLRGYLLPHAYLSTLDYAKV